MSKDAPPTEPVAIPPNTPLFSDLVVLSQRLGVWAGREESKAEPQVRKAAADAMTLVDGLLADLHAIRDRLHREIRRADQIADQRVDALLAKHGKEA